MNRPPLEITSLSALDHILTHRPEKIRSLFIDGRNSSPRVQILREKARAAEIFVDSSFRERGNEPAKALLTPFEYSDLSTIIEAGKRQSTSIILALDHLQDPQNFGALCRTAEGLGVSGIILPKDRSVSVGAGVYHASVGAVETIPIALVGNLAESLRKLKEEEYWIVGTTIEEGATPPAAMPDFKRIVLLLGAELEGLSPSLAKICDWNIEIPLTGKIQSLNVSVAGGILMYELREKQVATSRTLQ